MTLTAVTLAAVTLAAVTLAAVTPAAVTPAAVTTLISDRPQRSKSVFFKRILNKKRYLCGADRCRPPAPTGLGAQNRYFLKGLQTESDTISVPAAAGRLLPPAPALKIDVF